MANSRQIVNLKAERLNRGLSLEAAGEQMGILRQTLWNAEHGKGVSPATAKAIADFYGYRVTEIWPVEEAAA